MRQDKTLSIAFLGALVPDTAEYQNRALRRSGNLVQDGIACGLEKAGANVEIFSVRPVPSFPKSRRIFFMGRKIVYKGMKMHLVSILNFLGIKTLWAAICLFLLIVKWAVQNRRCHRVIIVYNTYTPPLPLVVLMGKITGSKTFSILYDLGMPPKELNLGLVKTMIYRLVELSAKTFIPKLDGRIVINEAIGLDYSNGKDYIVIDGGLSQEVLSRIPKITQNEDNNSKFTLFIGGSISPINGSRIIGDIVSNRDIEDINVIVAGGGHDQPFIEELSRQFPERIQFLGMLDLDELFAVYSKCDVLMNLRILSHADKYLFPSKVIEYLATGIPTITTNAGHIGKEYGNLCYVIDNITADALANAIITLKSQSREERREKGRRAQDYMLKTHTWDVQSRKIFNYIITKIC